MASAERVARGLVRAARRTLRRRIDVQALLPVEPVSRIWGLDRGTPIDRYYIERALQGWQDDISGRVLEMADPRYTERFGGTRVSRSDVLHLVPGNPKATLVGDLVSGAGIPDGAFDAMLVINTFRLIKDLRAAIATCHRALAAGGVLLATFEGVAPRCPDDAAWAGDYWRFTSRAVRELLEDQFGPGSVEVVSHGNVRAAAALLYGLAVEDLDADSLDVIDDDYEVVIAARARKT